jgi:hypothetical protein
MPGALVLLTVIVQAAATDSQSQAHLGDTVTGLFGSHLGDHFVEFGGSWPKMPKAFFNISRCRLTVSNSRRNRAFSSARAAASAAGEPPPPSSRPLPIILRPAIHAPDRYSQFAGQLFGRANPGFHHICRITLKLFVIAPAKFSSRFSDRFFPRFRLSLHLSARSKTPHIVPLSRVPDYPE